jgi:hypothetical protein
LTTPPEGDEDKFEQSFRLSVLTYAIEEYRRTTYCHPTAINLHPKSSLNIDDVIIETGLACIHKSPHVRQLTHLPTRLTTFLDTMALSITLSSTDISLPPILKISGELFVTVAEYRVDFSSSNDAEFLLVSRIFQMVAQG